MTTLVIKEDSVMARSFIEYVKTLPFVKIVDSDEHIPGLPYTQEERLASLRQAEEDYEAGRYYTIEQMREMRPQVWK